MLRSSCSARGHAGRKARPRVAASRAQLQRGCKPSEVIVSHANIEAMETGTSLMIGIVLRGGPPRAELIVRWRRPLTSSRDAVARCGAR